MQGEMHMQIANASEVLHNVRKLHNQRQGKLRENAVGE